MNFEQFIAAVRKELGIPDGASVGEVVARIQALNDRVQQLEDGAPKIRTALDDMATELRGRIERAEKLRDQESPVRVSYDGRRVLPRLSRGAADAIMAAVSNVVSAKELLRLFSRDLSSTTASAGGVLVTPEYATELLGLITIYGDARKYGRVMPMTAKKQIFPALDGEGTDAQWVAEGGTPGANTEPAFASVELENEILMALTPIPVSLLQDSNPDVAQIVAEFIARKFAKAEDTAFFNGTGAGIGTQQPFTGVLKHSSVNTQLLASGTAFTSMDGSDLLAMQDSVETSALDGAGYYLHRSMLNHVRGLRDTTGRFIYSDPSATGPAEIFGFPVRVVEVMPKRSASAANTPFVTFGNLRYVMLGDRSTIAIASSEHAQFANLKILVRGFERVAVEVAIPSGLVNLKTNP